MRLFLGQRIVRIGVLFYAVVDVFEPACTIVSADESVSMVQNYASFFAPSLDFLVVRYGVKTRATPGMTAPDAFRDVNHEDARWQLGKTFWNPCRDLPSSRARRATSLC